MAEEGEQRHVPRLVLCSLSPDSSEWVAYRGGNVTECKILNIEHASVLCVLTLCHVICNSLD